MKKSQYFLVPVLFIVLVLAAACGNADVAETDPAGATDTESGATDNGSATTGTESTADTGITLQDISDAQKAVQSYHFKQTITVNDAENYTIEIYYKDNKMKTVSNIADVGDSYTYYDMTNGEMISYIPSQSAEAMRMSIDANSEEIPTNPLDIDYLSDYQIIGAETIDGQDCKILQTSDGSLKVWIMPEYGFPLKMEMNDTANDTTYVTKFTDLSFNDLTDADVTVPSDVKVVDLNNMGSGE